ncbi:MAG: Gfo/Idh/MocA family oxidoreductase [Ruminococcaceae bacterium]|nr:Gfo/Idh/MocA family oxidoreductase [Oscillospiraceae bacterium]
MKTAIIGTGKITERFIDAAQGQDIQLEAVLSRRMETGRSYGEKHGIPRVFTDIDDLAKSDIQAVYIASPNCCHAPQAITLLEQGKHVLCEKPIAASLSEVEAMYKAADAGGAILLEAMRSVHDPGFAKLAELVKEIGTVRRAKFTFCQYSSRYDNFKKGIIENAFNPQLANSALMDIGVYCVNPAVRLFGRPKKVTAESIFMHNGMEGMGSAILRYQNHLVELTYSKITQGYIQNEIQGEDGTLLIDAIEDTRRIELVRRTGEHEVFEIEKPANNMYYEVADFIKLVQEENTNHIHRKYSIMEMEVMDAIRNAAGISFGI